MSWFSKYIVRPVVTLHRAPDRMLKKAFKGDIKGALSVAASPFAEKQETRDRLLRRKTGAVVGAVGGFITGGPAGAVAGGIAGGLRASKGHGQIKDAAGSFIIGAGLGVAAGGAAGALGAPQYGGMAGGWGANLTSGGAANALDPVTGEFTSSYQGATGGGSSWGTASKVLSTTGKALPIIQAVGGAMQPKPVYESYSPPPVESFFSPAEPAYPYSMNYAEPSTAPAQGNSWAVPAFAVLGLFLLTR